jgi:hypothetical protein
MLYLLERMSIVVPLHIKKEMFVAAYAAYTEEIASPPYEICHATARGAGAWAGRPIFFFFFLHFSRLR